LCAVLLLGIGGAHADSHFGIYFADFRTGRVQRADPDGSNEVDLVTGVKPGGVTVDAAGGKVYWTDFVFKDINRANLDGTDDEVLFFLDTPSSPLDVALDVSAGQMYWTDYGTAAPGSDTQFISRGNMDGSGTVTHLVTSGDVDGGLHVPAGIALDVDGGKMYWTDYGTKKIQRANLDGSNVEDLVTGLSRPNGIALDTANGRFYWAEQNIAGLDTPGKIQYANLDGTGVTDLITGLDNPFRLALDLNAEQVYWTTGNVPNVGGEAGVILQANLDGTGGIETAVSGLTYPWGIAVVPVPEPSSVLLAMLGTMGCLGFGWRRRKTA